MTQGVVVKAYPRVTSEAFCGDLRGARIGVDS